MCEKFLYIIRGKFMKISFAPIRNFVKSRNTAEPFCRQYWQKCTEQRLIRQSNRESVSLHGYLNGINHHFISRPNPAALDEIFPQTGLTPREMITKTDMEFKTLFPTKQKITAYRCSGEKPEFFKEYDLYKKSLNVKKGDIVTMKEYAYATSDLGYANIYMPNKRGILYEIEIPENARISRIGQGVNNEITFPRNSRFECIGTKKVKNENEDYLWVKLRYLNAYNPFAQ